MLNASGMLILPWLVIGVFIASTLNSDFRIKYDVLSQLGASGSSTEFISPMINNFPIGILFILFGCRLGYLYKTNKFGFMSGAMLVVHGVSSILAGIFSCDPGCPIFNGSVEQVAHTTSGVVMFVSLLLSAALWFPMGLAEQGLSKFGSLSLVCAIVSSVFLLLALMGHLVGSYAGLFEALSYGVLCGWCFLVSYRLMAS